MLDTALVITPQQRIAGCLIGGAVGDALGAPFEGLWSHSIPGPAELLAGFDEFLGYPEGQFTDDTQLTLATVEAIVEGGGERNPARIAAAIAELWRDATVIGPGGACTQAADRLLGGVHWSEAGAPPGQAGNGTAMRAAVLSFVPEEGEQLLRFAADVCRITHRDSRSVAGGVAVVLFTRGLQAGMEPIVAMRDTAARVASIDAAFAALLQELGDRWTSAPKHLLPWIAAAGQDEPEFARPIITPFVVPTVLAAFYAVARHVDDWPQAVAEVIGFGGDTDTTGAIVGGILGARLGIDAVPQHLADRVVDSARIRVLAGRLAAVCGG